MKPFRFLALALLALLLSVQALAGPKEDIQAAMQAQDWAHADELLQASLAAHPKNSLAHYWRAQVQAKLGRMEVAAEELAAAKRIDPQLKFAGDAQVLARLEAAIKTANEAKLASPPAPQLQAPAQPEPELKAKPEPSRRGVYVVIAVGVVTAIALLIYGVGAAKRRARKEEVEQCLTTLQEARQRLDDARLWSDGNTAFSPEQKLGNYDRVNKLKGEIAALASGLKNKPSLDVVLALVARAEDEVADIRGLEKPSVTRARLVEADAQRRFEIDMERARRAPVATAASQAGSLDPASAFYLGSMLSNNAAHASVGGSHRQNADAGYDATPLSIPEFEHKPSFGIDIGGVSSGDTSFGGSFDGGGSSGGGDTSF